MRQSDSGSTSHGQRPPGVISRHEVYTLDEFKQRTGLSEAALRTARRAGLKVDYRQGRAFIRGENWYAYLDADTAEPGCA